MLDSKEYFDNLATDWDNRVFHDKNKINKILDLIDIKPGQNILDVGTGTGVLIPFLSKRINPNGSITAIDFSDKMIKVAKSKYKEDFVKFLVGDVHTIDLKENLYNHIICYSVFPHFKDKQKAINNMNKYLLKGGSITICHSQSRNDINNLHKNSGDIVKKDRLPKPEVINQYFNNTNINPYINIDNSEMYIVLGKKI